MRLICEECGEEVTDLDGAYREVVGWEKPGRGAHGRSGSSLVLREQTGHIAHPECITARQTRVSISQEALL